VVAVIVTAPGAVPLQLESLRRQLLAQLPRFKLPRALLVAKSLPLTASGKLDRRTCADRFGPLCADPRRAQSR
jgi:acyl-CoA synthetase (AMP-forming)/AMP-acid ligase II